MNFLTKHKNIILLIILIIFGLFTFKYLNDKTDELLNGKITELHKENDKLLLKKDSLLSINSKLNSELAIYSQIIKDKEEEISKLNKEIDESKNIISSYKKDREKLLIERKKIMENRKKVDKLIQDKISNISVLSDEDLIKSLKIKLNN